MAQELDTSGGQAIQVVRRMLTVGLTVQALGAGSVDLAAGAGGSVDGITILDRGPFGKATADVATQLMSGPEAFDASLTKTAENTADNINAFRIVDGVKNHNYFATASAGVVTLTQSTAGAITGTVACAATTITCDETNVTSSTDTPTSVEAGVTSIGTGFQQLGVDFSLVADKDVNNRVISLVPRAVNAFEYWSGQINVPAAGGTPQGITWAADDKRNIPLLACDSPVIIKPSGAGVWEFELHVI